MTLDDIYHILLVVLSASLSAHVIFSKSKDIWVALILITAMITELNTISYHNYNILLYQLYAVLTSWIMLLFFKTLTLSSLKKKIMTGMLGFLVIAGVINFMFFDSSVVIPVHFMVFSEPFIIMAALMVLGDFIKHSEKLEEQPRNLSVIVISILFYFSLRFPYLMLLNEHQMSTDLTVLSIFHQYLTFAFYLVLGIAAHMRILSSSHGR